MMEVLSHLGAAVGDMLGWIGEYERGILGSIAVLMVLLGTYTTLENKTPESPRYLSSGVRSTNSPLMSNKLASLLTYPSAFIIPCFCMYVSRNATHINMILATLMVIHYLQRTFIFGLLLNGTSKIPVHVFRMSATFCALNGYMIGRYQTEYAVYDADWLTDPRFVIGVALFFIGMAINIHSDHILRNLRKPGETGYKIPRGGLFEYVSGANYFGEIVEWTGFALACWTLHTAAFAFFTAGYIGVIKAFAHHRWYLAKFEDYPKSRKAVIPFLI
ncbi:3-oxo-5-alpha-steroid 4-dehydrogenase 1-like [Acanthaster planci]|uniref:3-oxo-5alpha-steroid 4-dehydrogenase (NADP(+)) n=1 Tax=Acanthaster planci TaxID=133434 RepID=A0A8B7Y291_ACAPL|nr:3-oxo-5-alpha-steroid 4-dehydrogenase 1-like [Acanthaster planci]XP_022086052.1 3-oxo-5-alpha-steroid 4-dehydrogenase 1-like [Acanthaster planci]